MSAIKRNYTINLYTANRLSRGRLHLNSKILFFNSDRHTSNIKVITDEDIDYDMELVFSRSSDYRVIGEKLADRLIEFNIPYEDIQEAGIYEATFLIAKGDKIMTTDSFTFTVRSSVMEVK